jgi:cell division protein ZapE
MLKQLKHWWQNTRPSSNTNDKDFQQKFSLYLQEKNIQLDPQQQKAIPKLQNLYHSIQQKKQSSYCGVYLWGGVGTGKTLLMDAFYNTIESPKIRLHHHELFKNLMNDLKKFKDSEYPLEASIESFSQSVKLACFDDLHLNDIADAKLWQGVFEQAQKNNLLMIITSNTPPHKLMDTPGYREKIKPLLTMMQNQLEIIEIDAGVDYRTIEDNKKIHNLSALLPENHLSALYSELTKTPFENFSPVSLNIQNRSVNCLYNKEKTIFFTLKQLCGTIRSYLDYLELSEKFDCIVITDINPKILTNPLSLQRFIWLIDVIYDKNKRFFIISNQNPIPLLQQQNNPNIKRTISRLKQLFGE